MDRFKITSTHLNMVKQSTIDVICYLYQVYLSKRIEIPFASVSGFKPKQNAVVHVVGSGCSVLRTLKIANVNDAFITCNLSVALRKEWDVVFFEYDGCFKFKKVQYKALAGKRIQNLFIKNNYPTKILKDFDKLKSIKNLENLYILLESQYVGSASNYLKDKQWSSNKLLVHQYGSTLFTMILFALRYKPERIILHGIDFGGDSFYVDQNFSYLNPGINSHASLRGRERALDVRYCLENIIDKLQKNYNVSIEMAGKS